MFGAMQTDPNLANYRYDPKTGRIVLLDFGAVQPIAPELAADFRALARVALDGGAEATRAAMLRIGYFGPATAPASSGADPVDVRRCDGAPAAGHAL